MSVSLRAVWLLAFATAAPFAGAQDIELVLEGVIVADNPAHSVALVRLEGAERARALRVGQSYHGHTLVEVSTGFARFESEDGARVLAWAEGPGEVSRGPWAAASPRIEPEWQRRSYSRATDGARLEKEIPVILSDTELTPRVVGGEIRGLELLRIPDGTLLSEAGLRPGDVLKSLNGQPLSGLESLWKLLARFDGKTELRLVVERRGEVVRLAYALEN